MTGVPAQPAASLGGTGFTGGRITRRPAERGDEVLVVRRGTTVAEDLPGVSHLRTARRARRCAAGEEVTCG
ncbi:hypothetical protein ACWEPC_56115 [Nonomuraea sp. NPDC004297]